MRRKYLILFCVLTIIYIVLFIVFNFFVLKKDYQFYVEKYSLEYNLESDLVYAVIKAESNFDEKAISKSGALGLMQIIPRTATWIAGEFGEVYEKQKLFEPETNIKYGCFYLNYLFKKFNDIKVVICAYNAGEGVVRNWIDTEGNLLEEKIDYEETKIYLNRVLQFFEEYKKVN